MSTTAETTTEAEVRTIIQERDRAIASRDVDAILNFYADDLVYFDAIPPFVARGREILRQGWEQCFPHMPEGFRIVSEDLRVFAGPGMAAAHWLWRFVDLPVDHPAAQTLLRATAIFERRGNAWVIVHEHGSVPFDPYTNQAVFAREA
ncbi:MAG: SgcJ/EcaC family oxidoreductase [Candidatus Hydrogenedentes bacterium]|nr:SgcJ/EcaC family oxidoreductase [Candidatus Hydrogenedentota bacterium]